VLAAIEEGGEDLDRIVRRVGRPVPEVLAIVADLEVRGLLVQSSRGSFEVLG
jgi:DNA-binding IclR family transcriptional regulator